MGVAGCRFGRNNSHGPATMRTTMLYVDVIWREEHGTKFISLDTMARWMIVLIVVDDDGKMS